LNRLSGEKGRTIVSKALEDAIRKEKQVELEKAVKKFEKKCYRKKDMKDKERLTQLRAIVEEIIK